MTWYCEPDSHRYRSNLHAIITRDDASACGYTASKEAGTSRIATVIVELPLSS
jgi:hypothetical protein